ncbi:hypothetical protein PZA11_004522 [Diplocarpon coronariae]|uniref:BTB domain-containing protein n=1 Tax=Diplocarpon coronariae TaxID=2795749 RepID=A0A218Z9Q9_9HELO|nr:hypothetical protein B2J93_4091 [Marssonina coronariae]
MQSPIIFKARGTVPDTRLRVLDTEFHVHSAILKMHSAFFYKFLDSPDKQDIVQVGPFKYEWATRVDPDGDWGLEVASNIKAGEENLWPLKWPRADETQAFGQILCAFYGVPYELKGVENLETITRLADYYCALPKVSHSILQPLLAHRVNVKDNAVVLIEIASKLRHAILFRECVVFLAGLWDDSDGVLEDRIAALQPHVRKIITDARNIIGFKLARSLEYLLRIKNEYYRRADNLYHFVRQILSEIGGGFRPPMSLVMSKIYRSCNEQWEEHLEIRREIGNVMANNLVLHDNIGYPGEGDHEAYFLCAAVDDEDLPWDASQMDW